MNEKRHIIMKYKNQIPANKSNYWHRSNKNWGVERRPIKGIEIVLIYI